MAAYTITPSAVLGDGSNSEVLPAGEDIDAGEAVYKVSNTWMLADCDTGAAAPSVVRGIAINSAKTGQNCEAQKQGTITCNAAFTKGDVVVLDGTAGKMAPSSDLAANDYVTVIGVAASTTELDLAINASQVKK